MEKTIRQNVYAIAVISFCIGVLYGLRAHAESATVTRDSTKSLIAGEQQEQDCKTAQPGVQKHLDMANQHLNFVKKEEDAAPKAGSLDVVNSVRQSRIADLATIQNDLIADRMTLRSSGLCRDISTDLLQQLDLTLAEISAIIADLDNSTKAPVKK